MSSTRRTALVTGASAGIGASLARLLASEDHDLVLVARREERLRELAQELVSAHGVRCECIAADLADAAAPAAILARVEALGMSVDVLVNNAGLSGKDRFADTPWPSLATELQIMVTAVTELAHGVLPGMRARRWGRILNLSSVAAFVPPGASLLYTGIKSYVLNMSQSLDMELKPEGIHVTALCPGLTRSEFHDVMGVRPLMDRLPGFVWQDADTVARAGYEAVMRGDPVCVPGLVNKLTAGALRPLPERLRYHIGRLANPFK
jgi:uncharacterized protein